MHLNRTLPRRSPLVLFIACLFTPFGQLRAQPAPSRDTLIAAARQMMEAARFCALITLDESGTPRVRAMDPFLPEDDMVVWLGTDRRTRKVQDIERDPRVTLYYFAPQADGYVSISGTARLVDDPAEKNRRWKSGWEQYYANKEADYILIAVTPYWMEVISYSRGIAGDPETWAAPVVEF